MISSTSTPKRAITEAVFERFKNLYLDAQLGKAGKAARTEFYDLKSEANSLHLLQGQLMETISSFRRQDPAVYAAWDSHKDALGNGISYAITHHAIQQDSEPIQSPDAATSAKLIVGFLGYRSAETRTQEIQTALRNAGIAIFDAMNGTRDEDDERTLGLESWTQVMGKCCEYNAISDEYDACIKKLEQCYLDMRKKEALVMGDITPASERSSNPQEDLTVATVEHLQNDGLLNDYNTFSPIIASLIDQYGFDRVPFKLFEKRCNPSQPPQAAGLFPQSQSITANREEDPENQMLHYSNPYQHRPIHESKYGSSSTGYQQAPTLDDDWHAKSELYIPPKGIKASGKLQNASKATKRVAKSAGNALRNFVSRNKGYRISEDMESAQVYAEGKPGAPKTRSRINPIKELLPEVSESSSISKAGLATSAGALIGFALLATSIGIAASIAAGRAPFLAQTPILSQNPFILTALMPAILGAITLALIVAAIARMRTNKDITLEFSLGHITQQDAMLLHGSIIRILAHDLPPEECDRISQQTSSALLQSIKSTLRWQIQDIGEGTIDIEEAVARPNHDPRIKVLSLIYSDSEYAESAHNSENKLVITLRAGSMSEKKAWLDVIAKCTPAQSHPESLHHVRRHYSDTDPSFGGGKTTFPIGHNGPPALIAKTTKVTINTTQNAGDVLIDSVKNALNVCHHALIDASKKEPSSIMSEHSISSPSASEQRRTH